MRIINGKKFYKKQMNAAIRIDNNGWDYYDQYSQSYQWYSLYYNPDCGYVRLWAGNSGDCYGDYGSRRFSSPHAFKAWADYKKRSVARLLGDIDETNTVAMQFANCLWPDKYPVPPVPAEDSEEA